MTHTDIAEMIQVLRDLIEDGFTAAALAGMETLQRDVEALATHTATAASVSDEREAFEAWATSQGYNTERDMFQRDMYQSTLTWELWRVWQARADLRPAQAGVQHFGWAYDFLDGVRIVNDWVTSSKDEAFKPGHFNQRELLAAASTKEGGAA